MAREAGRTSSGEVADRTRTGTGGAHNPECSPFTPRPPQIGTGTTGLEPATSRLTSERSSLLSYAPEGVEGGIGSPQPETETLPLRRLRSQLLPIGAPASACPRRHLLTGRPWRLSEASCTLGPTLCAALVPSLPRRARRHANPRPSSAGGIRTHGLELMRLARTAAPLPRAEQAATPGKPESPLRRHRKRRLGLAGRTRTCDLRFPKPAGQPASPSTRSVRPAKRAGLRAEGRRPWSRTRRYRRIRPARSHARPSSGVPRAGFEPASPV